MPTIDNGATIGATLLKEKVMDTKNKPGQKGSEAQSHTKQPTRPGSEQVKSGTGLERQSERQQPKVAEKQKEGHKIGKK